MAKLYFRYAAMNAGKTTSLMQVAHNYKERGMNALVCKPSVDTKAGDALSSRIWLERKVDVLIQPSDVISDLIPKQGIDCVLIDEAQFLSTDQVNQLRHIAVIENIPVICYAIRTDFMMQWFPGSTRLLEIAHSIEELKTICHCGKKATCNMRIINNKATFSWDQVAIDGDEVQYESVCGRCYENERQRSMKNG